MNSPIPLFEPLSRLFRGDANRVRQVLEVFARVTPLDLERLDAAFANRDWATLGMLAHKMKAGCLQIGEQSAAAGLDSIERAHSSASAGEVITRDFAATRDELDGVMTRVVAYLAAGDQGGEG
jgi:HPt (histidine-containing phosphotransfer) domain-containing protein